MFGQNMCGFNLFHVWLVFRRREEAEPDSPIIRRDDRRAQRVTWYQRDAQMNDESNVSPALIGMVFKLSKFKNKDYV